MAAARWFPSPNARQTLLSFPHESGDPVFPAAEIKLPETEWTSHAPKSPPTLPTEVWDQILRPLCTIALKKLRLICRQWNIIGVPRLFETVYLNCFEESWAGLVALSRSCHAAMVRCVEWNSLVLYDDCDNAATWTVRYRNLIHGVAHHDTVRFHDAYNRISRARRSLLRSTSLDIGAEALRNLGQCHEVVISDQYDLTSDCDDPQRAAITSLPSILNRPGTWGLRPHCRFDEKRRLENFQPDMLDGARDFLQVISRQSNLTSMTLSLWDSHLDWLAEPGNWQESGWSQKMLTQNRHIVSLNCKLNSPDRSVEHGYGPGFVQEFGPDHEVTFNYFGKFSNLRDLRFEVTLSHPNSLKLESNRTHGRDSDGSEVSSIASTVSATSYDELDDNDGWDAQFIESRPEGFTAPMFECLIIPLQLPFLHLPNLRSLTLSNLSVNASSLLCFLCCQQQLPASKFWVRFEGTVILYDFYPYVFFDSLKELNVVITWDSESTYFYPVTLQSLMERWDDIPNLQCYTRGRDRNTLCESRYQSIPHVPRPATDEITVPEQWATCPPVAKQKPALGAALIWDRPSGYRYSIAHLSNVLRSRPAEKQVYRVRERGKQTIWEWVATDVALDPETDEPWPDTYLLHSLLVRDGPSDDGSDDYYEDEEAPIRNALIFDSPFEVAARESRYKQDLLQQYERELLGTDLLDLHKHQSDLAVERLRLSEASAMLDTEEYVLHQYETELLGLDLIARDLREGLKELLSFIDMSDVSGN